MPGSGTVPESRVCVPRPGQKQSGTIKCPWIGSTALIMVKELLYLVRVGTKSTFSRHNLMPTAFIWLNCAARHRSTNSSCYHTPPTCSSENTTRTPDQRFLHCSISYWTCNRLSRRSTSNIDRWWVFGRSIRSNCRTTSPRFIAAPVGAIVVHRVQKKVVYLFLNTTAQLQARFSYNFQWPLMSN